MKFFIVSYPGGMFGEFFCYILSQDQSFYKDYDNRPIIDLSNDYNRFLFPNYLTHVNFNPKTFIGDRPWPITQDCIGILEKQFKGKNLAVPTHWFDEDLSKSNLPAIGVKLYCKNKKQIIMSYLLHWLKSHKFSKTIWPSRLEDLRFLSNSDHCNREKFKEMLNDIDKFENWKFLAYYFNILVNGVPDLKYYIEKRFQYLLSLMNLKSKNWNCLDIGEVLLGNTSELKSFNNLYNLEYPLNSIVLYNQKNFELIKNCFALDYNDPKFIFSWQNRLIEYIIEE